MRLIDADEIRIKPEYMHDICGVVMIRVEDIARILNDMPTIEPEPHWIPCSERLPENNCQCIVTAKVKHVDGYPDYEVDTADYTDGIFTTANGWWGIESIIAWMQLPEGYRGEQDEIDNPDEKK